MLNSETVKLISRRLTHLTLVVATVACLCGPAVASAAPIDLGPLLPGGTGSSDGPGSSGGNGTSGGSWQASEVALTIAEGSVDTTQLVWTSTAQPRGQLNASISGALAGVARVEPGVEATNGALKFPVVVTMPARADSEYSGSVQLKDGDTPIGPPATITVTTNFGSATTIPDDLASPAPDRIVSFQKAERVGDELLVTVDPSQQASIIRSIALDTDAVIYGADQDNGMFQLRYRGKNPDDVELLKNTVSQHPGVLDVSSNYIGYPEELPNDPKNLPWSEVNDSNWGLLQINAPAAWNAFNNTQYPETKVGIIDVGPVYHQHEDLLAPIAGSVHNGTNIDFAKPDQRGSHPSHVAGIACAASNNGFGITGVAQNCDLRDYYLPGAAESSDFTHLAYYLKAMNSAGKDRPRVVNLSVGFHPGTFQRPYKCPGGDNENELTLTSAAKVEIETKLSSVVRKYPDTLWVAAAGNACINVGNSFPAALAGHPDPLIADRVVAVAASTRTGGWASYSNFGNGVSLAAPGGQGSGNDLILSTTPSCAKNAQKAGALSCSSAYTSKAGTSQAAPYVTGTAALAFSAQPTATPAQVKRCLVDGAESGGRWVSRADGQRHYIVNALETILCARGEPSPGGGGNGDSYRAEILPFTFDEDYGARDVDFDPAGNFVAAQQFFKLLKLTRDGKSQTTLAHEEILQPWSIAHDRLGNVFYTDLTSRSIYKLAVDGSAPLLIYSFPGQIQPFALAVGLNNELIVGSVHPGSTSVEMDIWKINPLAPNQLERLPFPVTQINDLAVGPLGEIYGAGSAGVWKLAPGETNAVLTQFPRSASGVTVNPAGDIFVAYHADGLGTILKLDSGATTPFALQIDARTPLEPERLATNGRGDLIVAEWTAGPVFILRGAAN